MHRSTAPAQRSDGLPGDLGASVVGDPPPPLVAVPLDAPELEDGQRLVWRIAEADPAVDVVRRVARQVAAEEGWLDPPRLDEAAEGRAAASHGELMGG